MSAGPVLPVSFPLLLLPSFNMSPPFALFWRSFLPPSFPFSFSSSSCSFFPFWCGRQALFFVSFLCPRYRYPPLRTRRTAELRPWRIALFSFFTHHPVSEVSSEGCPLPPCFRGLHRLSPCFFFALLPTTLIISSFRRSLPPPWL